MFGSMKQKMRAGLFGAKMKWLRHRFFKTFSPSYLVYVNINPFELFAFQLCVFNCVKRRFEMPSDYGQ